MKELKQFIREIIPVIFGVLIALAVNNWNEDRKDKRYLNQIYTSIGNELEESRKELKESISKQQILIDNIGKYYNDESISIIEIILMDEGGIQGPSIKNNSWRAIASSKIELMEFEKLSALSEIDESKKLLELKREKLFDFLMANLKAVSQEKKEVFLLLSQEIISTAKYAQLEIEEFLKQ